jgi:putative aldouronate transport system substrate-binding protein
MNSKKVKKLLSLSLAAVMTLSLTACGGSSSSSDTSSSTSSTDSSSTTQTTASSDTKTDATEAETPKERQTITFSVIDVNAGSNNSGDYADEIIQDIEDYTGVDLDIVWYANDALSEKNSLALASPSTMPQIMSWGGTVTGDVVSAAKNGAFVDLNDYIWDSEKYPNLSQMSQDVAANLTVDGALIAIPRTRVVGRYGLSYRQDWAEKLGVELPENATPDDVYDMLYAFTYGDPDGNGVDDTIGMEMTSYTGPFDIIQTWFGCGNGWQEENGELVPVWTTDEYFEAVEYIKKLYDDGLMPADFYSRPTDSWSNGCKTGENGVFIDVLDSGKRIWQYFEATDTYTTSVVNSDEAASMVLYGAVNGHTLATAGYNGFFTLSATTLDSEEKIEAALTLLDKLNDPDMLILTQYGLEGVNYEMENGYLVDTDTEDETLALNYKGLNQLLAFLPSAEETGALIPIEKDKFAQAQEDAYAAALDYAEINPALSYLVNSATYSATGADLDTQVTALRTQYICGEINLDTFKSSLDSIRSQGYDDIIKEVNEQYAANK